MGSIATRPVLSAAGILNGDFVQDQFNHFPPGTNVVAYQDVEAPASEK
jgi:hypothetical protein